VISSITHRAIQFISLNFNYFFFLIILGLVDFENKHEFSVLFASASLLRPVLSASVGKAYLPVISRLREYKHLSLLVNNVIMGSMLFVFVSSLIASGLIQLLPIASSFDYFEVAIFLCLVALLDNLDYVARAIGYKALLSSALTIRLFPAFFLVTSKAEMIRDQFLSLLIFVDLVSVMVLFGYLKHKKIFTSHLHVNLPLLRGFRHTVLPVLLLSVSAALYSRTATPLLSILTSDTDLIYYFDIALQFSYLPTVFSIFFVSMISVKLAEIGKKDINHTLPEIYSDFYMVNILFLQMFFLVSLFMLYTLFSEPPGILLEIVLTLMPAMLVRPFSTFFSGEISVYLRLARVSATISLVASVVTVFCLYIAFENYAVDGFIVTLSVLLTMSAIVSVLIFTGLLTNMRFTHSKVIVVMMLPFVVLFLVSILWRDVLLSLASYTSTLLISHAISKSMGYGYFDIVVRFFRKVA